MGQNLTDWSLTEDEDVVRVVGMVASKVAREYSDVVERDDLVQEAYILIATNPAVVRREMGQGLNYLNRWIWSRLVDQLRPQAKRSNKTISINRLDVDL